MTARLKHSYEIRARTETGKIRVIVCEQERSPSLLQLRSGFHAGIVSACLRARHATNATRTRRNKKPGAWPGSLRRFAEDL
jgi:hypothetical protein